MVHASFFNYNLQDVAASGGGFSAVITLEAHDSIQIAAVHDASDPLGAPYGTFIISVRVLPVLA